MTDYEEVYQPVACLIRIKLFADRFFDNLMDRHKEEFPLDRESIVIEELSAALRDSITPDEAEHLLIFAAVAAPVTFPPSAARGHPMTKLETYIKAKGIKPAELARKSGYSCQHLLRLRKGEMRGTEGSISAVTNACRRIAHDRALKSSDLFDV